MMSAIESLRAHRARTSELEAEIQLRRDAVAQLVSGPSQEASEAVADVAGKLNFLAAMRARFAMKEVTKTEVDAAEVALRDAKKLALKYSRAEPDGAEEARQILLAEIDDLALELHALAQQVKPLEYWVLFEHADRKVGEYVAALQPLLSLMDAAVAAVLAVEPYADPANGRPARVGLFQSFVVSLPTFADTTDPQKTATYAANKYALRERGETEGRELLAKI
jgi:hypothetical protein